MVREPMLGLRHLALWVLPLEACTRFYVDLLGFSIEWQPDPDNVYLTSGPDNLALHRSKADFTPTPGAQRLDHLGFVLASPEQVDLWHAFFVSEDVKIHQAPKTHRDGARSFYCADPAGNVVQMIYHPPIITHMRKTHELLAG